MNRPFRFRPAVQPLEDRLTPVLNFATAQPFTVGTAPWAVVTADFNGDGRADIAVTNYISNTVSVLRNTTPAGGTTSTFAAQQTFAVGTGPGAMAVGDFDGDGRTDLAVANFDADTVSVLRNTTPAGGTTVTFAAQQTFTVGDQPNSVAVGDFDADGRADLAVADSASGANTVSVLRNTTVAGTTTLTFATQAFAVGSRPVSVAVADLNGDGRTDLATANFGDGNVSVLRNTTAAGATTPTFAAHQTFAAPGEQAVVVADFNGDGRPDLAVANRAGAASSVSVLRNVTPAGAATTAFAALQSIPMPSPLLLAAADLDGDGRPDLAAATFNGSNVPVLRNTTPAGGTTVTFAAQQSFVSGSFANSLAVGDFNADGLADLVTADTGQTANGTTVSVLLNTSTGATVTGPALVGQFGSTGVWRYNRATNTWGNLTGANANALAAAPNGNVVAALGGNGVWYFRPTVGWSQINGFPATAVAIDQYGNAYASFNGFGTAVHRLATGGWTILPGLAAAADKLVVGANGDVIANVPAGVYRYRSTTGWVQLNGISALALAVDANGDIAASFNGFGTYRHKFGVWTQINGVAATSLAVGANGAVAASFGSFGIAKYIPHANGWQSLHTGTQAPSLALDAFGNVFATLSGFGVYEFNPYFGWRLRRNVDAGILRLG